MGDVVVTRADREAAALVWCGPEGAKKPRAVEFIERGVPMYETLDELALTIARVRIAAEQRTREECAREVEAMADTAQSALSRHAAGDAFANGGVAVLVSAVDALRALAERMRKGANNEGERT